MNQQTRGIGSSFIPRRGGMSRLGPWRRVFGTLLVMSLLLLAGPAAFAGKPVIDESYANGQVVYMIGPHLITNPNPSLFARAEDLYIVAYPLNENPGTDTDPKSLPGSGYVPQCNPCYHFGPPSAGDTFAYHDHVLSGSPGFGNDGTAGEFKGPWRIILLKYTTDVLTDPNFKPVTSEDELDAAEAAGKFQQINPDPNADNKYELELPVILICPLVSSHG